MATPDTETMDRFAELVSQGITVKDAGLRLGKTERAGNDMLQRMARRLGLQAMSEVDWTAFGRAIRFYAADRKITIRAMAEQADIPSADMHRIANGGPASCAVHTAILTIINAEPEQFWITAAEARSR